MKRLLTVILSFSLLVSILSAPVSAVSGGADQSANEITWYYDESTFSKLFSPGNSNSPIPHGIYTPDISQAVELTPIDESDSVNATYTLTVGMAGNEYPITVSGVLELVTSNNLSVYFGILKGSTIINGELCRVNVVLQRDAYDIQKICAGVTIAPQNAKGLDDYIIFYVGENLIAEETLPDWVFKDLNEQSLTDDSTPQRDPIETMSSEILDSTYAYFSDDIGGWAQYLEMAYDDNDCSAAVAVTSNTDAINNHFSDAAAILTIVSGVQIGLRIDDNSQRPYIAGIESFEGTGEPSTAGRYIENYLPDLLTILEERLNYPSYVTVIIENLFDILSANSSSSATAKFRNDNSYVTFRFLYKGIIINHYKNRANLH